MISFATNTLWNSASLNKFPEAFQPHYSTQMMCVLVNGNQITIYYGASPDGSIDAFQPIEFINWQCDQNRHKRSEVRFLSDAQLQDLDVSLASLRLYALEEGETIIAFDIIRRLIETVSDDSRERLTSDDLSKGIVELGRKPPAYKWVINYLTGGLSFRGKGEDGSTATMEDYLASVVDITKQNYDLF